MSSDEVSIETLTRKIISHELQKLTYLNKNEAYFVVSAVIDIITNAISDGKRVELRDFGVFTIAKSNRKTGYDFKKLETIDIDSKKVVKFKPASNLKKKLNS